MLPLVVQPSGEVSHLLSVVLIERMNVSKYIRPPHSSLSVSHHLLTPGGSRRDELSPQPDVAGFHLTYPGRIRFSSSCYARLNDLIGNKYT